MAPSETPANNKGTGGRKGSSTVGHNGVPKLSKKMKREEAIKRAQAGQAALDRGEQPKAIDPREEARYAALAAGEKVTRATFGFSVEDALRQAEQELAKYDTSPINEDEDMLGAFNDGLKAMNTDAQIGALKTDIRALVQQKGPNTANKSRKSKKSLQLSTTSSHSLDDEENANGSSTTVDGDFEVLEDDNNDDEDASDSSDHAPKVSGQYVRQYDEATFGSKSPEPLAHDSGDISEQSKRFDDYIRLIIRRLKITAADYVQELGTKHQFCPMTRRFLLITHNAEEDWLVDQILHGVPQSTKVVLGKEGFTTTDLLSLPRWNEQLLQHKGVYMDIVHETSTDGHTVQLYVGSGTGKCGISQRWSDYVACGKRSLGQPTGLHCEAILNRLEIVNLRALAKYGSDPISWVTLFSESVFMVLLGTVRDTGKRWSKFKAIGLSRGEGLIYIYIF